MQILAVVQVWRNQESPLLIYRIRPQQEIQDLFDWLVENQAEIRGGTAQWQGQTINESTEFRQFYYVISFLLGTFVIETVPEVAHDSNRYLKSTRNTCMAISLFAGWWAPLGILETFQALLTNFNGGRSRSAASLIEFALRGWDAPNSVSGGHERTVLSMHASALDEVERIREKERFESELAVRIRPGNGLEVAISFDFPVSDGSDWLQNGPGYVLLVDKRDESTLAGSEIRFQDGRFVRVPNAGIIGSGRQEKTA